MSAATKGPYSPGRFDMATIVDGVRSKYIYGADRVSVAIATGEDVDWGQVISNASWIAEACNAVPALLEENEQLRHENDELRKELEKQRNNYERLRS